MCVCVCVCVRVCEHVFKSAWCVYMFVSIGLIGIPWLHLGPLHPGLQSHFTKSGASLVFSHVPQLQKPSTFVSHGAAI